MAPFHLKDTSFLGDATDYEKEILCAMLNVFGDGDTPHANLSTLPDVRVDHAEDAMELAMHGRVRPNVKHETLMSIVAKLKNARGPRSKLVVEYDVTGWTPRQIAALTIEAHAQAEDNGEDDEDPQSRGWHPDTAVLRSEVVPMEDK